MNQRTALAWIFAAGLLTGSAPAWAHHSFAAEYDVKKPVHLSGTITRMEWTNPHAWIDLDVKNPDGTRTRWAIEAGTPNTLRRNGFSKSILDPGTLVIVNGYRAKDGSHRASGTNVTLPSGRKLLLEASGS